MSQFKLTIDLDNDAFAGDNCGPELARTLEAMAKHYRHVSRSDLEGHAMNPRDINGNRCGSAHFDMDDDDVGYEVQGLLDGLTVQELKQVLTDVCGDVTFAEENENARDLRARIADNVNDATTTINDIKEYLRVC